MGIDKDFEDFEFVIQEILRFKPKSVDEAKATLERLKNAGEYERTEFLYSIAGPDKGIMTCGREAHRRISEIMKRQIQLDPQLMGRVSLSTASQIMRNTLLKRMNRKKGEIDEIWLSCYLANLRRTLRIGLRARTFILPCTLVGDTDPERFSLGPIEFVRSELWLQENTESITRADLKESEQIIVGDIQDQQWVMLVPIDKCDPVIGRERALLAGIAALNVMRLFVSRRAARHFRIMTERQIQTRWSGLVIERGKLDFLISRQSEPRIGDGWKLFMNSPQWIRDSAAQAINGLTQFLDENSLRQRFLDALHWYGDACTEENEAAAIVKATAGIERLTITEGENGYRSKFIERGAILAFLSQQNQDHDYKNIKGQMKRIYDFRSKLMHGRITPLQLSEKLPSDFCVEVARQALVGALVFFGAINGGAGTDNDLKIAYLDWLKKPEFHRHSSEPTCR